MHSHDLCKSGLSTAHVDMAHMANIAKVNRAAQQDVSNMFWISTRDVCSSLKLEHHSQWMFPFWRIILVGIPAA